MPRTAVIIGAGPAGLTAAYELTRRTDIRPVVLEMDDIVGGISRTVNFKGNRMDIGGHRFFTKSDRVMAWWLQIFPIEKTAEPFEKFPATGPDAAREDNVMLVRTRQSRIYYLRNFFDYPLSLNLHTLSKLGFSKAVRMGFSYLRSLLFPIRHVHNFEELLINRFGRELYYTFFKAYTEKVWGVPGDQISAEWGVQRIKDLSIARALWHAATRPFRTGSDLRQKATSTSLIERFLYPKYGPGQLWEEVARRVVAQGGEVRLGMMATAVRAEEGHRVTGVQIRDVATGRTEELQADYVFSTMPVKTLIAALDCPVPDEVRTIAEGLLYRDFIAVGLLAKSLMFRGQKYFPGETFPDTWLYIQEPEVKLGRLQIFNNWNRDMVNDPDRTIWLSLEYFCNEGDDLWSTNDTDLLAFAVDELARIGLADKADVLDGTVVRMKKTYPAYVGAYERFDRVRDYVNGFQNLFLIGRNGMHRYNNQDHSMLTAMTAVDNILAGVVDKSNLWAVNTEQEYHEERGT